MVDPAEHCARDVLPAPLEHARSAKAKAGKDLFETGRAQACCEVIATLVSQLAAFGVDRSQTGIDPRLDVEEELLS